MQITDEMIEAAELAMFNSTTDYAKAALTASYPLIRDRVLEEAARRCEKELYMDSAIMGDADYNSACLDCAQAIRDMKGNKDATIHTR